MSDGSTPARSDPIPYADPTLPTGPTGYRGYAYPSDAVAAWNARVADDGVLLRLEPDRPLSRRFWQMTAGVPVLIVLAALSVLLVWGQEGQRRDVSALVRMSVCPAVVIAFAAAMVVKTALEGWRGRWGRTPWIAVDRRAGRILLPREKTVRALPFSSVVRLQLVSTSVVHTRAPLPLEPVSGELQIVFRDGRGREQTWCVVSGPDADAVRKFAAAFREATGVPVSLAYPLDTGEWVVRSFDGRDDA